MAAILELRSLTKDYPGQRALDGVTFSVEEGSFFSLLGPSGCGKTTTLRLIAGFEQPTTGEVWLRGQVVNHRKPYERNVSTVFQNYALFPHLSARENVAFGLRRRRRPAGEVAARVNKVLALVSLEGKESRRPNELSGGERQRVALARSLVIEPDVLLLDEPLAALDPKLRQQMRLELKAIERRVGITFLLVTHDQEEALSLSDRLAVMNRGAIEQIGDPQEVYLRPRTRFVAGFLGEVNWVDGVGVRPEAVRIARDAVAESNGVRRREAEVTGLVFLGDRIQVHARLASGEQVVAQVARDSGGGGGSFRAGQQVQLYWLAGDEMRFN